MSTNPDLPGALGTGRPERSPDLIFRQIRNAFLELGILNQDLSLEHGGVTYRVSCDDTAFMVYRVNENSGLRHHVPGWPVCLVNSETIFEEYCSPGLASDHFACGLSIENWIEIIGCRVKGNFI